MPANLVVQNPQDLSAIFGDTSSIPAVNAGRMMVDARTNNELNQQAALQDYLYNQQMNPVNVRSKQLANDTLEAQLPGHRATSRKLQNDADLSDSTFGEQLKALRSKLTKEADVDQVKSIQSFGDKLRALAAHMQNGGTIPLGVELPPDITQLLSQGPKGITKIRAIGDEIFNSSDEIMKARDAEGQRRVTAYGQIDRNGENARRLMQMQIDAGKFDKSAAGRSGSSSMPNIEKIYVATRQQELEAQANGDMETAAKLHEQANTYYAQMLQLRAAGKTQAPAGSVDVGALPGANIPTVPNQPPVQFTPPQTSKPSQSNNNSLADVQKMYPGVPADKLKQAYKAKFGVDLQ